MPWKQSLISTVHTTYHTQDVCHSALPILAVLRGVNLLVEGGNNNLQYTQIESGLHKSE